MTSCVIHMAPAKIGRWAKEDTTEILGIDSAGNTYKWKFDSMNSTAHAVWQAFHDHIMTPAGKVKDNKPWNPVVLSGSAPKAAQDSFMYREQNGVKPILLDDDNCDCLTSLNIGHAICHETHSTDHDPANPCHKNAGVNMIFDHT